ncbi:hypothetical protein TNCV_1814361 [Trichonephila clavipes]|nr:hypothetical protein TNCV_1814361 [Trichonephila clavipes]
MHDPWAFDLVPCSQPPVGVKQSESRLITECYSFPNFYTPVSLLSYPDKACNPVFLKLWGVPPGGATNLQGGREL